MKCLKLLFCILTFNSFFTVPVFASNDVVYCSFSLSLTNKQDKLCNNFPFISPFNDSRTNLILFLNDPSIQEATFKSLSSPQSGRPYIANNLKPYILPVPFEITIYDYYLDEAVIAEQRQIKQIKKQLDAQTKQLAMNVMKNDSLLRSDDFLSSPALEFIKQIANTQGLNNQERNDLFSARYLLFHNPKADISSFITPNPSFTARHFANYLQGISAFYKKDYPVALAYFQESTKASIPWVKEAAIYMIARTLLNQGQLPAYNNWYDLNLNKVDQQAIKQSEKAFHHYLTLYPRGKYVNSAKSLQRRIFWLQNNGRALARNYEHLLNYPKKYLYQNTNRFSVADLILEIDNKLFFNRHIKANHLSTTPKLLAVYDLLKMRNNQLSLPELEKQQSLFKQEPVLYNYLLACYYTYIQSNPKEVLTLIPKLAVSDEKKFIDSLTFSGQVLRALALENLNKWDEAKQTWLALKPLANDFYQQPTLELGLALNYEKANRIKMLYKKDSPITTPQLRYILLRKNANRHQLKYLAVAENTPLFDKATIIYLLLYKNLMSQNYKAFLADNKLLINNKLDEINLGGITKKGITNLTLFAEPIPSHPNYPCPSPIIIANVLKVNPTDARSLICLGEFKKHYQLPYAKHMLSSSLTNNNTGSLGTNKPTHFGLTSYSPLKGYLLIINDKEAADEDKAYALYSAIRCFSGRGVNQCDDQNIPRATRKEWFQLLHSNHAKTSWAKQQLIYW